MSEQQPISPRQRLQALLAIPERQRTDAQWDELIELEVERDIAGPVDDVFARLADIDHYRDWLPKSLIFKGGGLVVPDEDVGLGTEFVDVTPMGRLRGRWSQLVAPLEEKKDGALGSYRAA